MCIASFVEKGHRFALYTYDDVVLPAGAERRDAATVLPQRPDVLLQARPHARGFRRSLPAGADAPRGRHLGRLRRALREAARRIAGVRLRHRGGEPGQQRGVPLPRGQRIALAADGRVRARRGAARHAVVAARRSRHAAGARREAAGSGHAVRRDRTVAAELLGDAAWARAVCAAEAGVLPARLRRREPPARSGLDTGCARGDARGASLAQRADQRGRRRCRCRRRAASLRANASGWV